MWANYVQRNETSLLGLVASDFAYKKGADILFDRNNPLRGEFLSSFPDSRPAEEYSFPASIVGLSTDPLAVNYAVRLDHEGVGIVTMPNWRVFDVIEDGSTGFGAVIFRGVYSIDGQARTDYMVAFRGTDGRDGQDWFANMQLGLNQWRQAGQGVINRLQTLQNADGTPFSGTVHFTGQSLGGALAQYGAYEFAQLRGASFRPDQITLTTFNAFAAGAGLLESYGTDPNDGYKATLLSGVSTAHYSIENDIVHVMGAVFSKDRKLGHLNAYDGSTNNLYHFGNYRAFENGGPKAGEQNFLSLIEGHRIESGFYAGMDRYQESLVDADPRVAIPYVDTSNLQQIGEVFARIFGGDRSNTVSAWSRVAVGVLAGGLIANPKQFQSVLNVLADSLYNSGDIGSVTKTFIKSGIPNVLLKAFALPVVKIAGAGLFLASIADLMDRRGEVNAAVGYANSFLANEDAATVIPISEAEPYHARAAAARFGVALSVANPNAAKDAGLGAIASQVESLELDLNEFGSVLYAGGDWVKNTAHYLHVAAHGDGIGGEHLALFDRDLVAFLGSQIEIAGLGDEAFVTSARAQLAAFVQEDLGWALANANAELVTPYEVADNRFAGTVNDFQDYSKIESALRATLEDPRYASIHSIIRDALGVSNEAWQTVVVQTGHLPNPFDDLVFNPDDAALPAKNLSEGSTEVFTAYVPYEAGPGGQRVRLTVSGEIADKLTILSGEEIEVEADGTFTLTIPEGQREITFSIAALEDVDADAAFTLSAQLVAVVDGVEVATHEAHQEATVTLDAREETPPAGGMEFHGDWGPKLYPTLDLDGNPIPGEFHTRIDLRYPHSFNIERDAGAAGGGQNGAHPIVGHEGADHIWTGDQWVTNGAGGDDYIEGKANVPNMILGDFGDGIYGADGDDVIEGGENAAVHFPDGQTFNGVKIETSGDDILLGGGGNDELYADRIALLDAVFDPATPMLDMLGDWISGGRGDDRIFGSAAHDALFGAGGADEIHAGAGNDVLSGDDDYEPAGFAFWEMAPDGFGVTFFPVTNLYVPGGFDYYRDFGGDDVLDGGAGDDLIFGMIGDDTLIGGSGADRLEGWDGNDQLFGGDDDDYMVGDFGRYEEPAQRMPAIPYLAVPGALAQAALPAEFDQSGEDLLDGGGGNDRMYGDGGDDSLFGRDGNDQMYGDGNVPEEWHGIDFLDGGAGNDSLFGGGGDDRLFGGAGDDSISGDGGADYAEGGLGEDTLSGGDGDDLLKGGDGNDVVSGDAGADVLEGGAGADQLAGGDGADVLRGGADADMLHGGNGDDSLFGGSGDDILIGGEGNDRLDGGLGADLLQGGLGDDTYVFGLGSGAETIDDSDGISRLAFSAGIGADDLSVALDAGTLTASIAFGGIGDSVTVDLNTVQIGGVDFAGGTTWGRKEFRAFLPALVSEGSTEGEVLVGREELRNELLGLGGDDYLVGSANDDLLAGGEGADGLDGAAGSDLYVYGASDLGIDQLADSEVQGQAYLDWYYGNLGILDWIERGQHGGEYRVVVSLDGDQFTAYYESAEEAAAAWPTAEITFVEPLPSVAPLVRGDDEAALQVLAQAGVLSWDVVELGDGLELSGLALTVSVDAVAAAEHPDQPWYSGGTLSVRWADGDAGFDLQLPGIVYGFDGEDLLTYRLGEGIEAFRFADGASYSLEEILRQAEVVATVAPYVLARRSGAQTIASGYTAVRFADDIHWEEIVVSRDGVDLLLTLADGSAQGRVEGWYADPESMPQLTLQFSSDPDVGAETLTELGLQVNGTDADDVLTGADGFSDLLSGGPGNDVLDGGTGKDTYLFRRGDGTDFITEVTAGAGDPDASVIILEDFFSWEARFGLGSLVVDLGNGDAIHFTGFDAVDPYSTPVFDRLEFAGGEVLTYADAMAMGFQFFGSDDDDALIGTGVADYMEGAGGNDTFQGLGGDDTLLGGEGSDTYVYAFGHGSDYITDWDETPDGEVDTVRFQGITPDEVLVTRDDYSYYLYLEGGGRIMLDSAAREAVAEIERVEFDDATIWTPSDLAARVELLPATEGDDPLWGTSEDDVIHGFGGSDALFGNGGDDFLAGGEGGDIYMFSPGDGADVVDNYDADGSYDSIFFSTAHSTDATLTRSGDDLVLTVASDGNRIALRDWYVDPNRKIDGVFFGGDSANWDAAMLEAMAPDEGATPPEVAEPLADQAALEDEPFNFAVPEETFSAEGELVYSVSDLPSWLSFDPDARTFAGTPANEDVGTVDVTVTATDAAGESAADTFTIDVVNTNDAPVVASAIADQSGREGEAFELAIGDAIFADPDASDSLALSASAPQWLVFEDGVFRGTPGAADAGEYVIEVRATDEAGESAATSFRLIVEDVPVPANRLVGTRHNDVLRGTDADEVLIGRRGNDRLLAGGGDDVLRGGRGNDELRGGWGDDVYVYGPRGGHDEIIESGGVDVLRFREGITGDMLRVMRRQDDLVLDITGPHGSVTIKDWFASQARRVDFVQFADGTVWDEDIIRRRVRKGDDEAAVTLKAGERDPEQKTARKAVDEQKSTRDWYRSREETVDAIWQRLAAEPSFDFESLTSGGRQVAADPEQIARQWAAAHSYASGLASEAADASSGWQGPTKPAIAVAGFGFEASIGAARGQEGLKTLEGLAEGFRRL